jgi:hypothetical protein
MRAIDENTQASIDGLLTVLEETRVRAVERRAWALEQPEPNSAKAAYLFELDEAIAGVDRSIANLSIWLDRHTGPQ